MEIFPLLPAIFSAIISIMLFYNAEKEFEWVSKIWSLMIGLVLVFVTIFLAELGMKFINEEKKSNQIRTEYFSNDYY
jgi:uncharacterized membrane protein